MALVGMGAAEANRRNFLVLAEKRQTEHFHGALTEVSSGHRYRLLLSRATVKQPAAKRCGCFTVARLSNRR
jgi:ABC-type molybdenum transport system ATPase subunit/photorepair protein PhrA